MYAGKTNQEKDVLTTATHLWKAIKDYCTSTTGSSEIAAYLKFTTFEYDNSISVEENLTKFENIVYTIRVGGTEIPDKLVQAQLLQALHGDEWNSFKSSVSGSPPDKYSALKSRIVREIIQRGSEKSSISEVTAMMASTSVRGRGKNQQHYRSNYKGRGRGRGRGRGGYRGNQPREVRTTYKEERSCYACGRKGHIAKDCYTKRSYQRRELNAIEGPPEVNMTEGELNSVETRSTVFIIDSGATHHCCNDINQLSNYEPFSSRVEVKLGGPQTTLAFGQGSIDLHFRQRGNRKISILKMNNVLYVPSLRRNLFSLAKAADAGWKWGGDNKSLKLIAKGQVITAERQGNLYYLKLTEPTDSAHTKTMAMVSKNIEKKTEINTTEIGTLQAMHEALGHINKEKVKELLRREEINFEDDDVACTDCIRGKQHRATYRKKPEIKPASPGEIDRNQIGRLVHTDLCKSPVPSLQQGYVYFMAITEDYTRYRKVYFLQKKEQAKTFIEEYLKWFYVQTGNKVKAILCDNGTEFVNSHLRQILAKEGCELRTSAPYCPQQNGLSEKTNRTIIELSRTLMISKELKPTMWSETVNCVVTLMNIVYRSPNTGVSPYEGFYGERPHLARIHPFGSKCFLLDHDPQRKKWMPKGIEAVLLGFDEKIESYRLWVPSQRKFARSKNVVFPKQSLFSSGGKESHEKPTESTNSSQQQQEERTEAEATLTEPQTIEEALSSKDAEKWNSAMREELEAMKKNQVWTLTELPEGRKSIPNRWIYKYKTNAKGEVEKNRARLVIKGFRQKEGIDFKETFSPVVRFDTIRLLLALSAEKKLQMKSFDIKTAFLLAPLDEEIFMDQPEGFEDGTTRKCKLNQSLYGLKQAPRAFKKKFDEEMLKLGFVKSVSDNCLFIKNENGKQILLCHYVDDGIISAPEQKDIENFFMKLEGIFELSIKPLSFFLGIHVHVSHTHDIHLSQTKYITEVVRKFGQENGKTVATPTDSNVYSREDSQETSNERYPFRELIGSLNYIAIATRPDVSFAISILSLYLDNFNRSDWLRALRVLKYLEGTKDIGITFTGGNKQAELKAYSDSDYAADPTTRRSISSQIFMYNNGPIVWCANQQKVVTLSSTEAEFLAAGEATKTALWISYLFKEIGREITPTILVDNVSAIRLIKNPEFFKRVKHVDVKYKFLCEKFERGQVKFEHVPSEDNIADLGTKNLPKGVFLRLRGLLGMR